MASFWRQRSGPGAYALGLALALTATALHWAIEPWVGSRIPFLFYLPMILVAASFAGRGPALVVVLAGALNGAASLPPLGQLTLDAPGDRLALAAYLIVGLALVLFGARMRLISRRAADAEQRLRLAQRDTGGGLFEGDFGSRTGAASATMAHLLGQPPVHGRIGLAQWRAML